MGCRRSVAGASQRRLSDGRSLVGKIADRIAGAVPDAGQHHRPSAISDGYRTTSITAVCRLSTISKTPRPVVEPKFSAPIRGARFHGLQRAGRNRAVGKKRFGLLGHFRCGGRRSPIGDDLGRRGRRLHRRPESGRIRASAAPSLCCRSHGIVALRCCCPASAYSAPGFRWRVKRPT